MTRFKKLHYILQVQARTSFANFGISLLGVRLQASMKMKQLVRKDHSNNISLTYKLP